MLEGDVGSSIECRKNHSFAMVSRSLHGKRMVWPESVCFPAFFDATRKDFRRALFLWVAFLEANKKGDNVLV